MYYIDTETDLFRPGRMAPELVSLAVDDGNSVELYARGGIERVMSDILQSGRLVAAHNAGYDFAVLLQAFPCLGPLIWKAYDEDRITCTMVREKLLDIAEGQFRVGYIEDEDGEEVAQRRKYSLGDIVKRHFKHALDKDGGWRLRYIELLDVPICDWPADAVKYAKEDVEWGRRLFEEQEKCAAAYSYDLPTQFLETRAQLALQLCSAWGLRTDYDSVRALETDVIDKMGVLRERLYFEGLVKTKRVKDRRRLAFAEWDFSDFDVLMSTNTKEVQKRVKSILGDKTPLTDKKRISTSKQTIEDCDDELLNAYVEFKALEKLRTTYIKRFYDGAFEPIHAGYNEIGAESARTSSFNPNVQNQPRLPGLRECFISRPGTVFIACDYDSQELRTLAQSLLQLVGRSKLAKRYQEDPKYDPHAEFGGSRLGLSYEEALRLKEAKDPEMKAARQQAKIALFGLPGGMGVPGLKKYARGYGQRWTPEFCQQIKMDWLKEFPEMSDYFSKVRAMTGETFGEVGTIIIPSSEFRRGGCGFTHGSNSFFQTLAAHASKEALFRVAKRCYNQPTSALYGSRIVVFVHDEIVIEAPELTAHEAALELETVMVEAMSKWCPDVPCSATAGLTKRWRKDADPFYDSGGRLITYEEVNT